MEAWRKNLYILWGVQFLAMAGMNLVVPFLPLFIRELGVTDPQELARWSGLVFSGPFLLSLIATPLWGTLGDRYGRKMMVLRALIGLAISQVIIGFSQDVYQLFFFRIIQGGISGFIASSLALVSTSTPKDRIGYALGLLQSSTAAGMLIGPLIGGVLADLVGFRHIFFITAVFCFISAVAVAAFVKELHIPEKDGRKFRVIDNALLMLSDKRLRVIGLTLLVSQISVFMVEPIFTLYVESFGSGVTYLSTLAGSLFSVTGFFMIFSAPWWGRLNDKSGKKRNLCAALLTLGLFYLLHVAVYNLVQLGFLRAFLGFARGGVLPALYALVSISASNEQKGGIMAIAASLTICGKLVGPMLGGFIASHFGYNAVFLVNGSILLILSAAVCYYLAEPSDSDA